VLPKKVYKKFFKDLTYSKPRLALLIFLVIVFIGVLILVGITGWEKITKKEKKHDPTQPTTISYKGKKLTVAPNVLEIAPEELNYKIIHKEEVIIMQVATPEEWYAGHIPGSSFASKSDFSSIPPPISKDKDIVLVSKDGTDSALAVDSLVSKFGFDRNKVKSLKGGLSAWQKQGYKLEKR